MLKNIFDRIPAKLPDELAQVILKEGDVTIERIVSRGQASPDGFWYDDDVGEWVLLLQGKARLQFYDGGAIVNLYPGDYLHLPPHCRHRVEWTDPDQNTVWLAVYYG